MNFWQRRSSHWRCSIKKAVLDLKACKFNKKRLQHRCFPVNIKTFLRAPNLENLCERYRTDAKYVSETYKLLTNFAWNSLGTSYKLCLNFFMDFSWTLHQLLYELLINGQGTLHIHWVFTDSNILRDSSADNKL